MIVCGIPVSLAGSSIYMDIPNGYPRRVKRPPATPLAANIQMLRMATRPRLSQTDVALALGIGQPAVSKWETGDSEPDASTLPALAALLNATLDKLMEGVDASYDGRRAPDAASALARTEATILRLRVAELESTLADARKALSPVVALLTKQRDAGKLVAEITGLSEKSFVEVLGIAKDLRSSEQAAAGSRDGSGQTARPAGSSKRARK